MLRQLRCDLAGARVGIAARWLASGGARSVTVSGLDPAQSKELGEASGDTAHLALGGVGMRQEKTWVATFDEANCRVFTFNGVPRQLVELEHERRAGRHKPDFPDRAGRVYESSGARRSGTQPHTDPERRLETAFVQGVVERLSAAAEQGAFDSLIVAASPRALGAFRAAAPKALSAKVKREVHGAFVNGSSDDLLAALNR